MNKDSMTLGICWDVSGFNYGLQVLSRPGTNFESLAVEAPVKAACFDDTIDLKHIQARYCLTDEAPNGMQTCKTFLAYLKGLAQQIDARSDAEVAPGNTRIERPCVLMVDNHASRFSEEVLEAASGACP